MAIYVGAHPGGKGQFALAALVYEPRSPAMAIHLSAHSGTQAVVDAILGVMGEWGELAGVAIDAPLSWSGQASGWRACDEHMKDALPDWASRRWVRSPNEMPGAVVCQGPALGLVLRREAAAGVLPAHPLCESWPRLSLARMAPEMQLAIRGYKDRDLSSAERAKHVADLMRWLVEMGLLKLEVPVPATEVEIEALVTALGALVHAGHDRLTAMTLPPGDIQPLGDTPVVCADAPPR